MDEMEDTPKVAGDKPFDFDAAFAKLREMREEMAQSWAKVERHTESEHPLIEFKELQHRHAELQPKPGWLQAYMNWNMGSGGEAEERRLMEDTRVGLRRLEEWHSARGDKEAAWLLWFVSTVFWDRLEGHGWPSLTTDKGGQGSNSFQRLGMALAWLYIEAARRGLTSEHDPDPIGTVCRVYAREGEPPLASGTVHRWRREKLFDPSIIPGEIDKGHAGSFPNNEEQLRDAAKLYKRKPSDTFPLEENVTEHSMKSRSHAGGIKLLTRRG